MGNKSYFSGIQRKPYGVEFFQDPDDAELFYEMLIKRGYEAEIHELNEIDAKEFAPMAVSFQMNVKDYLDLFGIVGELRESLLKFYNTNQ